MGGGVSWDPESSLIGCKSYICRSENSVKGSKTPVIIFHWGVKDEFRRLIQDALDSKASWITRAKASKHFERTGSAIAARYKKCKSKCLLFDGYIKTIRQAKPTGDPTDADIERAALAMYNNQGGVPDIYRYLRGTESPGKPFPYALEYEFLKTTANFTMMDKANGHVKALKSSAPSSAVTESAGTCSDSETPSSGSADAESKTRASGCVKETTNKGRGFKRPVGCKRTTAASDHAKELKRVAKWIESLARASHKKARIQEETLEVERKKAAVDHMKATMELFSMEGSCPDARAAVMKQLQQKVLDDLAAEKKAKADADQANMRAVERINKNKFGGAGYVAVERRRVSSESESGKDSNEEDEVDDDVEEDD